METPRANYKLGEVGFFLKHLKTEQQRVPNQHPEALGYYLSAFLNAAYSVTGLLELEVKDQLKQAGEPKTKYDTWCEDWRANLSKGDRDVWDSMRNQRVKEVHLRGADTARKQKAIPAESVSGVSVFGPVPTEGEIASAKTAGLSTRPSVSVPEWYLKVNGQPSQVVQLCEQYVGLLDRLLKDANSDFP